MIYDTVKAVLTKLDAQGAADHDDWEEQVAARLSSLEASYAVLRNPNRDLIDYSDLATQAAYVFRYVLSHAEFNYDFLKIAREKIGTPLFKDTVPTITSGYQHQPRWSRAVLIIRDQRHRGECDIRRGMTRIGGKRSSGHSVAESFRYAAGF